MLLLKSPIVCCFLSLNLFLQVIPLLDQTLNVLTTEFKFFSVKEKHKITKTSSRVDTEKTSQIKVRKKVYFQGC